MQIDVGMLIDPRRRFGTGVAGHFGDAFQVAAGVQGGGYEGVAEGVGRQLAVGIDFGFAFGALEGADDPFDRFPAPGDQIAVVIAADFAG